MTEETPFTKAEMRRLAFVQFAQTTLGMFGGGDVNKIMALAKKIEEFVVRPAQEVGTATIALSSVLAAPVSTDLFHGVRPNEHRYYHRKDSSLVTQYRAHVGAHLDSWAEMRGSNKGNWIPSGEIRVRNLTNSDQFTRVQPPADMVEYEYFRSKGSPNLVYRVPTYAHTTERAEFNSKAREYTRWERSAQFTANLVRDPEDFDRIPDPTERKTT
jgi:hypothetical protein